ncbi:hypothetical protein AURDEDRAFT_177695 [Auricularia subglabra TFB-10046 SS5]|uniref:Uncharacterized protein n=1 Tax=Auricularia subglabra (strain TFB-10046 / SS5) TaxID=717982 RepID=J0LA03_AURST|nr:hypothetical protein AURDEDRAFT_177695 [Auricularia subglabra TFB-10046 SS5]
MPSMHSNNAHDNSNGRSSRDIEHTYAPLPPSTLADYITLALEAMTREPLLPSSADSTRAQPKTSPMKGPTVRKLQPTPTDVVDEAQRSSRARNSIFSTHRRFRATVEDQGGNNWLERERPPSSAPRATTSNTPGPSRPDLQLMARKEPSSKNGRRGMLDFAVPTAPGNGDQPVPSLSRRAHNLSRDQEPTASPSNVPDGVFSLVSKDDPVIPPGLGDNGSHGTAPMDISSTSSRPMSKVMPTESKSNFTRCRTLTYEHLVDDESHADIRKACWEAHHRNLEAASAIAKKEKI